MSEAEKCEGCGTEPMMRCGCATREWLLPVEPLVWEQLWADHKALRVELARERAKTEALTKALRGMVEKWAPHSGLCCEFVDGAVVVTEASCVCEATKKAARAALGEPGFTVSHQPSTNGGPSQG